MFIKSIYIRMEIISFVYHSLNDFRMEFSVIWDENYLKFQFTVKKFISIKKSSGIFFSLNANQLK